MICGLLAIIALLAALAGPAGAATPPGRDPMRPASRVTIVPPGGAESAPMPIVGSPLTEVPPGASACEAARLRAQNQSLPCAGEDRRAEQELARAQRQQACLARAQEEYRRVIQAYKATARQDPFARETAETRVQVLRADLARCLEGP